MTKEEIKANTDMYDLVRSRYGITIRNKMCRCPFHGKDKNPSMKIFRDGYKCFACGANGDVFSFVMEMEHCDFKTAFISLGGEYENLPEQERREKNRRLREEREQRELVRKMISDEKSRRNNEITELRDRLRTLEPFSDEWCTLTERVDKLLVEVGCYG